MRIGLGLSIPELATRGGKFSPASLFADGAQGVWYSPDDYSTLFQTINGTTPVTAVEQPVGLMLDKSQGLVLGSELVTNGGPDFTSTTGWTGVSSGGAAPTLSIVSGWFRVTANGTFGGWGTTTITYPASWIAITVQWRTSGGANAARVTTFLPGLDTDLNGTSGTQTIYLAKTGGSGEVRLHCKDVTGWVEYRVISVKSIAGNHAVAPNDLSRPVLRARYNTLLATETLATQSVTTLAASYKLAFSGAGSITLSGTATGTYSAGTNTITCTAGTLTLTVSGTVTQADLRLASTATSMPAYQRVTTSTDYATAGFLPYLAFDGSDDSFGTNSINFSATDKMSTVVGATKLSDSALGILAELSADASSNNGSFFILAPSGASPSIRFDSRGTNSALASVSASAYAAPYVFVASALGDISGDRATLRLNGTQVAQAVTDQGTGNYGNYPLFIGRRNNANFPFNGRIYGLIVAGKTLSASELSATEAWMNSKTGAY